MIFITDRTQTDIDKIKSGDYVKEDLQRASLTLQTFNRWKQALESINPTNVLPVITFNTRVNCTNPTQVIKDPEGATTNLPRYNDPWYYWKAIDDLRKQLPDDHTLDLRYFPSNMDNLTFKNVNALELVMEYFYNNL